MEAWIAFKDDILVLVVFVFGFGGICGFFFRGWFNENIAKK